MNNIITIVTPSLNQGEYLEQTIKSVLNQEGDFFIDYIIADGGSVDNSVNIIKKYEHLLKNKKYQIKCKGIEFRWWSKKDSGQTNALNNGFKKAKGDILAWINSDDYYVPAAFQTVMENFKKNKDIDLIYGNCYEIFKDGTIIPGESVQSDFKKNLEEGCQISQPATFFTKRSFLDANCLDESFNYCMDYDLWMKILKNNKALFIRKDLAFFRYWEDSKTNTSREKFIEEENKIRKKYGGPTVNPGSIHRLRQNSKVLNIIKRKFPKIFEIGKSILYWFINLIKHKK